MLTILFNKILFNQKKFSSIPKFSPKKAKHLKINQKFLRVSLKFIVNSS